MRNKIGKIVGLIIGDIGVLYISLLLALIFRYQAGFYRQFFEAHFTPFTLIFVLWLIVFYIAGLYDFRRLKNNLDFLKTLGLAISTNAILSVLFFYLIPAFGITPKTNLFIFMMVFGALETIWRRIFNRLTVSFQPKSNIVLSDSSPASTTRFTAMNGLRVSVSAKIEIDATNSPATSGTCRP